MTKGPADTSKSFRALASPHRGPVERGARAGRGKRRGAGPLHECVPAWAWGWGRAACPAAPSGTELGMAAGWVGPSSSWSQAQVIIACSSDLHLLLEVGNNSTLVLSKLILAYKINRKVRFLSSNYYKSLIFNPQLQNRTPRTIQLSKPCKKWPFAWFWKCFSILWK